MKVFIVDDETASIDTLKSYLAEFFPNIQLAGVAKSTSEAIKSIKEFKPDLVLLDIELSDGSGFDIIEAFKPPSFKVIFITAFDQFAVQAFRFSAVDYILKPVDPKEFQEAIKKAYSVESEIGNQLELLTLLHNLSISNKENKRIVLRTCDDIHLINITELIRVESDGAYSHFHLDGGNRITVSQNIKQYDDILTNHGFFRCHQSHIINVSFIKRYHKVEGGTLILKDGTSIPVSLRKKEAMFKLFEEQGL